MKKATRILVPLLLALVILASCGWYLFVYDRDFTRDTLLSQARFNDLHGNSRLSSWFYNMAYSFSGHDENVAIELANQYKADGNYTKAEYTLTTAINSGATVELYLALSKTYVEQDKLLDAISMLDNVNDSALKAQLEELRPSAPKSNYEAGYYSQYMDIALSSSSGKLYYTMDGDYPSIHGTVYEGPITLPAGETTIYAIAVDDNGLVSPLTVLGYTITGVIEEVTFTDAAIETAIRDLIGADSDDVVYTNELWEITEFTVPEGAATYGDLSLMSYLEKLTIHDQNLDTLSYLSSLNKLKTLDLTDCRFPAEDLSYLAALPSLTDLTLANCGLSTIANLANAQNLTYLDLSSNTVRNLEALSSMTSLAELNLQHNALTNLSALSSLGNLQTLDVSYNSLTSLAPIATCIKLTTLNAENNQLSTLDGVNNLSLLTKLSVNYNSLTNVSTLASCTALTSLSIAHNSITDISALSALTNLEIFDFAYNEISALPSWQNGCALQVIDGSYNALTSIDILKQAEDLCYVYMDYNQLTNIDAIANLYHLVQVNVFGNEISDVSALTEHNIIVNYDPTN